MEGEGRGLGESCKGEEGWKGRRVEGWASKFILSFHL